jgi:hypothetical protein
MGLDRGQKMMKTESKDFDTFLMIKERLEWNILCNENRDQLSVEKKRSTVKHDILTILIRSGYRYKRFIKSIPVLEKWSKKVLFKLNCLLFKEEDISRR